MAGRSEDRRARTAPPTRPNRPLHGSRLTRISRGNDRGTEPGTPSEATGSLGLILLVEARAIIDRVRVPPLITRKCPVTQSIGKLAGTTVRARRDLPPRKVSAMDGYAVYLGSNPTRGPLTVHQGSPPSGAPLRRALRRGEASYITTGAELPAGANAIVRVEATRLEGDRLWLTRPTRIGQDILAPGESMERGDLLLERGQSLSAVHLAALIAQRVRTIPTLRIRATILPFGDELIPGDSDNATGTPEFIGPTLASLLPFAEVELLPPIRDDPATVPRILAEASHRSDLLITIGGSSAGRKDVTKASLRQVGDLLFEGVTTNVLKRGAVGLVSGTPVVVLPGQLIAAITVFHEHGLHVLSRMVGRELRRFEEVRLGTDLRVDHRMDSLFLFAISEGVATPLPWGVARITTLLGAQAFAVLDHDRQYRSGQRLRVQRLWSLN